MLEPIRLRIEGYGDTEFLVRTRDRLAMVLFWESLRDVTRHTSDRLHDHHFNNYFREYCVHPMEDPIKGGFGRWEYAVVIARNLWLPYRQQAIPMLAGRRVVVSEDRTLRLAPLVPQVSDKSQNTNGGEVSYGPSNEELAS